jgi:para-nitrobenzyl esterase
MFMMGQWKPAERSTKLLPVMIFIHGGGFASGANGHPQYSGLEFVSQQRDIIFASIK